MEFRGRKHVATVGSAVLAAVALAACSSSTTTPAATGTTATGGAATTTAAASPNASLSGTVNGSGSTFQLTFQQTALSSFKSVDPGITVNYSGVGSGTGRANLAAGTVNFAGSDSPIPSKEAGNFKGKPTVLYFPVLVGPITMAYNLPGVTNLKLTPDVIAGIFQGDIKTWNDPKITAINSGVTLPSTPITLAVRSDSSGTTSNFSLFLVDAAPSWKLGTDSTIKWPSTAHAAAGNGGVASVVKSTAGAIGYVDYSTAKASNLSFASVKNKDGNYVAPSTASASAAAAGVTVGPDLTFHAVWGTGAQAYPITYQSWVLVYEKQASANEAALLKAYIGYLLGPGQAMLGQLNYAPLPSSIDQQATAQLAKITS
jgi:phosphate transport system substrate-binding protein